MDTTSNLLDYPNMKPIPSYALYGEANTNQEQDWLHWETIQSRSRLHGYRIAPHRHEQFFQILHLTGGRAQVTIDAVQHELKAPAVVVVPALTVHAYRFSDDVDGVVVTLMERDVRAAGAGEMPAAVFGGSADVGEAIDRLIAEADRPGAGHGVAMRALIALLLVAIGRARHASVIEETRASSRSLLHARAYRWLVDQRFRETRRIADYAEALGISPTHLNRVCREVLGASALQVIERRVALEARRQLLFSSLSVKQIGAELGYEDPAYFSRVLVRVLGMAPGTYRDQARG
ncbi:Transcriptional regulator, AraC-family [Devosia sp. LC5]|uniref:helix-turn-helix domain-containing protein n=1 Tax=Devosia sp. LC5 TaxID=1502724 RepID=UPI0004E46250|nr:helix-turn-helix domain-containing protein [Devosia sp. LC5]KFC71202.1 Transcriptional regulator, AraC-family [Devosia sp. LC5]